MRLGHNHPNLVTVFDFFEDGQGRPCLAMELVQGGSVADLLDAYHHLPPTVVRRIAIKALSALACLHDAQVLHRDLSPCNILVSTAGEVKVSDLNLVKLMEHGGQERSLDAATARAHELLGGHFDVDLRQTLPAATVDASLTAEVRYTLALAGFSAIVHEAAIATGRSIASMNVFLLTAALVEDARGPDALLDGVGSAGPVSLGSCGAACPLPADALRSALVTALVRDYLPSAANAAGLAFGDVAEYLLHLTGNTEPGLFDALPTQDLDKQPPVLALQPSPVFDELRDRIAFDAAGQPDHVHDTLAAIDLRAGLGDTCPVVYKHADLLRPVDTKADTNPLRWRMSALDDLVGVHAMDVTAVVQPPGNGAAITLPASATTTAAGEPVFEILLNGAGAGRDRRRLSAPARRPRRPRQSGRAAHRMLAARRARAAAPGRLPARARAEFP